MPDDEKKKDGTSRRQFLKKGALVGTIAAVGGLVSGGPASAAKAQGLKWDKDADVVVIGAGATGLPAAIVAREAGARVILVEAQPDIGGHAIVSRGNIPLGGGTSAQRKAGIKDSPDLLFQDLTDWSLVQSNGFPEYRYNDREIIRAFADNNVPVFDWLLAHGVVFINRAPDNMGAMSAGNSVPREMHAAAMDWPQVQTGKPVDSTVAETTTTGNGLMRPLEVAAKKAGVQILLEHKMTAIHREAGGGRVLGISVTAKGKKLNIRARKAVIIGTGGSTGNVDFRRMFDPRLTEEYCGLAGMPWSDQDASGEIAAMAIGASLWGLHNYAGEFGSNLTKPGTIGCQYGYRNLQWFQGSRVFKQAGAIGLRVADWQDVICVNMLGKRFYDELGDQYPSNNGGQTKPYATGSYLNARDIKYDPPNWINAAMAGIGDGKNGGGPIWAIFDADAAKRERWNTKPPFVDETGFFFSANTIPELASKIVMKYQRVPMPPANLEQTVNAYNGFVDAGKDTEFGKARPKYKIAKAPFYAAWCMPVIHDSRAGLRINARCQVQEMSGKVIPGLYCGGESAGGFSEHGLARAIVQGYIAAKTAVTEKAV